MVIAAGDLIYNDCITSSSTWEGRPSYLALKILWDLGSCNPSSGYSAFLLPEFCLLKTSGVKGVFLLFPPASPLFPHAPGLFLLFSIRIQQLVNIAEMVDLLILLRLQADLFQEGQ